MTVPKKSNTAKPKLDPQESLYQTLSLCRKAGKLVQGYDAVEEAVFKSKAWLVLYTADASVKTVRRMKDAVEDLVDVLPMPLTQADMAPISRKPAVVYAITDRNLGALCYDKLEQCKSLDHKEEISE